MRRFLRFRLSTLMLVILAFAILFWWRLKVVAHYRAQQDLITHLVDQGARVQREQKSPRWLAHVIGTDIYRRTILIDVRKFGWNDDQLQSLSDLNQCEQLDLSDNPISDAALKRITHLQDLEVVSLSKTGVTDAGMPQLLNLPNLKSIDLASTRVGDKGIAILRQCKNLETLSLSSNVTDEGMKEIGKFPSLRAIDLGRARISSDGLRQLADLKLEKFKREWIYIPERDLPDPNILPHLHQIDGLGREVSDRDVEYLAQFSNLESLSVRGAGISDATADLLIQMPNLKQVTLRPFRLSQPAINRLTKRFGPNLDLMVIPPRPGLVFSGGPNTYCARINANFMSLRNWDNLEQTDQTIDMVLAHFVDWTASHFSRLDSHTNIRMINIGEGSIVGVKPESIGEFPNLERVYFYCVELDSDAVRALGRMPKLHSVQFRNCWLPDDTFELLGQSSSIVELNVTQTAHSSAFTRGLSKLEGVTSLVLDETDFNDSDCAHLQGHSTLENLYMTSTEVTESTIDTLLTIPNLTEVRIKGTWISQDDKKRLHQAGIKCNR